MRADEQMVSVTELLHERAASERDRELYVFLTGSEEAPRLSYASAHSRACAVACALRTNGLEQGDRALLLYPPGLEFVDAFFGCLYASMIAVPCGLPKPKRPIDRLERIASNCTPAAVLTARSAVRALREQLSHSPSLSSLPVIATDAIDSCADGGVVVPANRETVAFLQYTSGSTGSPKGVIVTHGNILHNQRLIRSAFQHPPHSTVVGWLPTFHDMGLVGNLLQTVYIRGRCVLMAPSAFLKQPMRWLQTISQYGAYTSGGPNFAYDLCASKHRHVPELDLSGWRVAFNGAEPIRAETLDRFARTFEPYGFSSDAFYPCYGLAEGTLIVAGGATQSRPVVTTWDERSLTSNRAAPTSRPAGRKLVSCGFALGDQQVAIVDAATATRRDEREIGEIWVSGPSVAAGYWDDAERTASLFGATLDGRPALRTGDRGFIADGHLYVLGRDHEILTMLGKKYCANAIELCAETAGAPAVGRAAAFAIPSDPYPELLVACERERGAADSTELEAVRSRIRGAIARQFDLSPTVIFVASGALPRTPNGKLRRDVRWIEKADAVAELKHAVAAGESAAAAAG